jgi:hypothetical protein
MDIHFCDLCGVRVTDVDLRGGHGIRKQYDVICATCVELGHGKEWLARQRGQAGATTASQPQAAPAARVPAPAKEAGVIAHARDRVQTFEDGDESPAVAPQVIAAEEPEDGIATHELDANAVKQAAQRQAAQQQAGNHFAAAASSFSALAQPPAQGDAAADVDEDAEQGEGLGDESTAAPIIADREEGGDAKDGEDQEPEADGASPFGFKGGGEDTATQKDETLPVDREPLLAGKAGDKPGADKAARKPASSATFKKSGPGTKSSASNAKSGKNRPGKGPARKNSKNKNILVMSLLSLGILTMIMLITIGALKKPAKQQQTIDFDMSQDLKDAIKEARVTATLALKSRALPDLKAAKGKIQEIQPKIYRFEKEAKSKNTKWDEDAFGQYLENVDWPNTQLMIRNLNDEIVKQGASGAP